MNVVACLFLPLFLTSLARSHTLGSEEMGSCLDRVRICAEDMYDMNRLSRARVHSCWSSAKTDYGCGGNRFEQVGRCILDSVVPCFWEDDFECIDNCAYLGINEYPSTGHCFDIVRICAEDMNQLSRTGVHSCWSSAKTVNGCSGDRFEQVGSCILSNRAVTCWEDDCECIDQCISRNTALSV